MDLTTIGGLAATVAIIIVVLIMDGGSPAELFAHPSAILLTFVGALVATIITVPLEAAIAIPQALMKAFFGAKHNAREAIDQIAVMADKARREGLLALEEESRSIEDAFLKKGIMLVVDGIEPEQVRSILELDIVHMQERHAVKYGIFNAAGGFSPTFGIIGTVMGLISVLKSLSDPDALAKSIAAAFLATLWGLMSANLVFLPIGGKLSNKSHEEAAYRHMLLEGIIALQAGENPRLIRDKLLAFLPPKERKSEEEMAGEVGA